MFVDSWNKTKHYVHISKYTAFTVLIVFFSHCDGPLFRTYLCMGKIKPWIYTQALTLNLYFWQWTSVLVCLHSWPHTTMYILTCSWTMTAISSSEIGHLTMRDSECRFLQTVQQIVSQKKCSVLGYATSRRQNQTLSFPVFAPLRPITDIIKLNPCITLRGNFSLLWSSQINCGFQPAFYENVTGTAFPEDKVAGPLIYYSPPYHQG